MPICAGEVSLMVNSTIHHPQLNVYKMYTRVLILLFDWRAKNSADGKRCKIRVSDTTFGALKM